MFEKSTIYMAGVAEEERSRILLNFPFAEGDLPVRYLGLPLMTKVMRKQDYLPLVEKIRSKINTWTSRFLSYTGRLQMIKAVLMSIVNFLAVAFRLPGKCISEVEQLCASFLWSGPDLKSTGAKVSWKEICKLKCEGGLGIRALKEVNMVYGLKLIWRMLSGDSLWGEWIKNNLLKRKSFWEVKVNSQAGSWMWRKMLKLRDMAKTFYKKDVGNGRDTSFWHDNWSTKGVLFEILGERGVIDMGIRNEATVEEAVLSIGRRRRRHRTVMLNAIEAELLQLKEKLREGVEDVSLWRRKSGFKGNFSTQETWMLLREDYVQKNWAKSVWFSQATPKFSFLNWLAMLDRLSTMDRVARWSLGADVTCVLCKSDAESRNHLFLECAYSSEIWEHQMTGILRSDYTKVWSEVVALLVRNDNDKKRSFCTRYAFQTIVYTIWRERNKIKHGEKPLPMAVVQKLVDKGIRNKLSLMRLKGGKGMEYALQYWFGTRV